MDPAADVLAYWPSTDLRAVPLLRRAGATVVIAPLAGSEADRAFASACRQAGITPVAQADEAAARAAGFAGAAWDASGDEKTTRQRAAGSDFLKFVYLKPEQVGWNVTPATAILRAGQWPGIQAPEEGMAAATSAPWLDANAHVVAYLRGLFPERAAVLGYRPDKDAGVSKEKLVPFDSVELALADARAAGGNVVLSFPEDYAKALLAGEAKALAAIDSLGRMSAFLGKHAAALRAPGKVRVAVAAGGFDESFEVLNMMYRNNVCPVVVKLGAPLDAKRFRVLAAANLVSVPPAAAKNIMDFAAAGGVVLAAPAEGAKPWWNTASLKKVRGFEEREVYAVGAGQLIAYREPVADPSELALDAIDALGMQTRDVRVWMAPTLIAQLRAGTGGGATLVLTNYGQPAGGNFLVRVEGSFRQATLHAPERDQPVALKPAQRGSGTEFHIEEVRRVAVIALS